MYIKGDEIFFNEGKCFIVVQNITVKKRFNYELTAQNFKLCNNIV